MKAVREKLVGLLDYVEHVVRLDERVAMRLSDYRLTDGSTFSVHEEDTRGLPAVRHDTREDDLPIWLEVERLARRSPPTPSESIADWLIVSSDPTRQPELRSERIITVSAKERDLAIAEGRVLDVDVMPAPRSRGEPSNAPKKFDLRIKLESNPAVQIEAEQWISQTWKKWADEEAPRRLTIKLYQRLYKLLQQVESAGAESPVEVIWGIGNVTWEKGQHVIDRPLLERRVDIEIDDKKGGTIRIRPTGIDANFDLKPYEEVGCDGLPMLSDLIHRELNLSKIEEGVSPFARESFEPILTAAASRLDRDGLYAPDISEVDQLKINKEAQLIVSDRWVLFARPRSQHIILQDIERLRQAANTEERPIGPIAERLVTEPSNETTGGGWSPLAATIGAALPERISEDSNLALTDVFFPNPFNDDQLEIVNRLSRSEGVVIQGPPGTGKTHTIANLICHAMATGQRVLVVSRGEPALAVLRDQLPAEVRALAIAILASERQGLRQIEGAVREIQSVVASSSVEQRLSTIRRLEAEIVGLKQRIHSLDAELEVIALNHLSKIGPRGETPADLARRVVAEQENFKWFVDRPTKFASEAAITDKEMSQLQSARKDVADLIDHLGAELPSVFDLPSADEVGRWHRDLIRAKQLQDKAISGSGATIRIKADSIELAERTAVVLHGLVEANEITSAIPWLDKILDAAISEREDQWLQVLRERIKEWEALDAERVNFADYVALFPRGIVEDQDARAAVGRVARGERLWPLMAIGKSGPRALVAGIRINGKAPDESDKEIWKHIEDRLNFHDRNHQADAKWHAFLNGLRVSAERFRNSRPVIAQCLNAVAEAQQLKDSLSTVVPGAPPLGQLFRDPHGIAELVAQIRTAIAARQLGLAQESVDHLAAKFISKEDRTSSAIRQLLEDVVGRPEIGADQVVSVWRSTLQRIEKLSSLASHFRTIESVTDLIAENGAPTWAKQLRTKVATTSQDTVLQSIWRGAWDHAAADASLTRIDARLKLQSIAKEREQKDNQLRTNFAMLVRERTFYELERRLSPAIKTALVQFVRSLARVGKGTRKSAGTHRRSAREALARCYDAIPCWIMPTWRVAEQLPAELGSVDLIIVDEASQSDVTELPVLLRGRKVLIVGDDRQVSPTAPFVTHAKIQQLRHHFLGEVPYGSLLEPGESLHDLSRAVFPDHRLMLKEHFRCVEPIIRFSMQFYPEKMVPLRIPLASERLDPPLIDIYIPHGRREPHRKINRFEANAIVDEIDSITRDKTMAGRTIGVISLIGAEQAEYVRALLSERIGEELMQRHSILCGDSATFQGNERHIVFLSMVADPQHCTALTMSRYEQRFNVAASRARDRLYLVRSVRREELKIDDLKSRLIVHFEEPMPRQEAPSGDLFDQCQSDFEKDVLRELLERGYAVRPQVGALGYRIDLVVDGPDGRRLAIECDGDRFHGPEHWRDDMRRQRTLERVGWKFWRCFASSYYRDTDGVLSDLLDTLARLGIEPIEAGGLATVNRYTEHRIVQNPLADSVGPVTQETGDVDRPTEVEEVTRPLLTRIEVGDRLHLVFSNGSKRLPVELSTERNDPENGFISIGSPLGQAVATADDGDEIDVEIQGQLQRVLVEVVERRLN